MQAPVSRSWDLWVITYFQNVVAKISNLLFYAFEKYVEEGSTWQFSLSYIYTHYFLKDTQAIQHVINQCFLKGLKVSGVWQKNDVSFLESPYKPWRGCRGTLALNITQLIIAFGFNFAAFIPLWLHTCSSVCRRCCFYNRQEITTQKILVFLCLASLPQVKRCRVASCVCGPWHACRSFSLITFDNFCVVWSSKN